MGGSQVFFSVLNTKEAARLLKAKEKEARRREKKLQAARNSPLNPRDDLNLDLPEINASKDVANREESPTNSQSSETTMDNGFRPDN